MTIRHTEFIGHTMRISADGALLTGCKWDIQDTTEAETARSPLETEIIDLTVSQISEYLEGKRQTFSVPICPEGTAFRMKVWEELQKIPYGHTISYKELACRIGSPNACRAVANACGANPFPIIIPCHRVVASGGRIGGYTGGTDIKLALLTLELEHTGLWREATNKPAEEAYHDGLMTPI